MTEMPKVVNCNAMECAYNKEEQCHAIAITVGGPEPACDTFMSSKKKGGAMDMTGGIGACKVQDCMFNQSLECSAGAVGIAMHGSHADCETYKSR